MLAHNNRNDTSERKKEKKKNGEQPTISTNISRIKTNKNNNNNNQKLYICLISIIICYTLGKTIYHRLICVCVQRQQNANILHALIRGVRLVIKYIKLFIHNKIFFGRTLLAYSRRHNSSRACRSSSRCCFFLFKFYIFALCFVLCFVFCYLSLLEFSFDIFSSQAK